MSYQSLNQSSPTAVQDYHSHKQHAVEEENAGGSRFSKLRGRSNFPSATLPTYEQPQGHTARKDIASNDSNGYPEEPLSPWLDELLVEIEKEDKSVKSTAGQKLSSVGTDTFADQHGEINEVNSKWFSMLLVEVRKSLAEEMQGWGQFQDQGQTETAPADEQVRVFRNECSTGNIVGLRRAAKIRSQHRLPTTKATGAAHINISQSPSSSTSPSLSDKPNDILSMKFPSASSKLFEFASMRVAEAGDITPHTLLLKRRSRIARKDSLKRHLAAERRATNLILLATKLREENHWKFIRGLVAMEGKKRQVEIGSSDPIDAHNEKPLPKNEDFDEIVNSDESRNIHHLAVPTSRASESSKNFSTMSTSGGEDYEEEDAKFLSPLPSNVTSRKRSGINDSQYDGDSSSAAQGPVRQPSSLLTFASPYNKQTEEMSEMPTWVGIDNAGGALPSSDNNTKKSMQEFILRSNVRVPPALEKKDQAINEEQDMCVINMASPLSPDNMIGCRGAANCYDGALQPDAIVDDWNEATSVDFDFDEEHIRSKVRNNSMIAQNFNEESEFDEDAEAEKVYQAQLQQLRLVQSRRIEAEEAEAEMRSSQRAVAAQNKQVSEPQQKAVYRAINHEIKEAVEKLNHVPETDHVNDESDYLESGMVADIDEDTEDCIYGYSMKPHLAREAAQPLAGWEYGSDDEMDASDFDDVMADEDEFYHSNTFERIDDGENDDMENSDSDLPINVANGPSLYEDVQVGSDFGLEEGGVAEPRVVDAYMMDSNAPEHCPKLPRTPPAVSELESDNNSTSTDIADEVQRMNKINSIAERRLRNPAAKTVSEPVVIHALEPLVVGKDGGLHTFETRMGESEMYICQSKLLRNKVKLNDHHAPVMALMTSEPLFTLGTNDDTNDATGDVYSPNQAKELETDSAAWGKLADNEIKKERSSRHTITGREVQSHSSAPDVELPIYVPSKMVKAREQLKTRQHSSQSSIDQLHQQEQLQLANPNGQNPNGHRKVPPVPHPTQVKSRDNNNNNKEEDDQNQLIQPFAAPRENSNSDNKGIIKVPLCNFHPSAETADWLLIGTTHFPSAFAALRAGAERFDDNDNQSNEFMDMLVVDPFEALQHHRHTIAERESHRQSLAVEKGREILAQKVRKLHNIQLAKDCAHRHVKHLETTTAANQTNQEDKEEGVHIVSRAAPGANNDEIPLPAPKPSDKNEEDMDDTDDHHDSEGKSVKKSKKSWISKALSAVTAVAHVFSHKKEDKGAKNDELDQKQDEQETAKPTNEKHNNREEIVKSKPKDPSMCIDAFPVKSNTDVQFSSVTIGKHFPRTRTRLLAQYKQWEAASRLPPIKQSLSAVIMEKLSSHTNKAKSAIEDNTDQESDDFFSFFFRTPGKKGDTQFAGAESYGKALINASNQFRSHVIVGIDSDRFQIADRLRYAHLRDRARSLRIKEDNSSTHIADVKKDSQLDHDIDHAVYLLDLKMADYRRDQHLEKRKEIQKNMRYRHAKVSEALKAAETKKQRKHEDLKNKLNQAVARRDAYLQSRVKRLAAQESIRKERTAANLINRNIMSTDSE